MPRYLCKVQVRLEATLSVEADNETEARQKALKKSHFIDWYYPEVQTREAEIITVNKEEP